VRTEACGPDLCGVLFGFALMQVGRSRSDDSHFRLVRPSLDAVLMQRCGRGSVHQWTDGQRVQIERTERIDFPADQACSCGERANIKAFHHAEHGLRAIGELRSTMAAFSTDFDA